MFPVRVLVLTFFLVISLSPIAFAECDQNPSVSPSYSGPDARGEGTLSVSYSFPGTTSASQRRFDVYVDESPVKFFTPETISGTEVIPLSTACWRRGTHTIRVSASSCGNPALYATNSVNVTVESKPTVNISYEGPDQFGDGTVVIDYDFPNTDVPGKRRIDLWDGNNWVAWTAPENTSGTWRYPFSVACRKGTIILRAQATACGRTNDPDFSAEAQTEVTVSTDPTVTVNYEGPDATGAGTVVVGYDFPNTKIGFRRLDLWINDNWEKWSGPVDQSGTWRYPLSMQCRKGRQVIRARATACGKDNDPDFIDEKVTEVTVTSKPEGSISASGPDIDGKVNVTVTASFPNTGTRWIWFYIDGAFDRSLYPYTQFGNVLQFTISAACWSNGPHELKVKIFSCGRDQDPEYFDEKQTSITVDHHPSVSGTLGTKDKTTGSYRATITYAFKQSNDRRLHYYWIPSGNMIKGIAAPSREGTLTETFWPGPDDKGVRVEAIACGDDIETDVLMFEPGEEGCKGGDCGTSTGETATTGSCPIEPPAWGGEPVSLYTGAHRMTDADGLPGLSLSRTFDNTRQRRGRFGIGWESTLDARAGVYDSGRTVVITPGTPNMILFIQEQGIFRQKWPKSSRGSGSLYLDAAAGLYIHRSANGSTIHSYRATDGQLARIEYPRKGRAVAFSYETDGRLSGVADSWGNWEWIVSTNANTGVIESISVKDLPQIGFRYTYAADRLMNVTLADSSPWRTYTYTGPNLAEVKDASGALIEAHTFDTANRATSENSPARDITAFEYDLPGRVPGEISSRIVWASGEETLYFGRYIAGQMRTVEIKGQCACSSDDLTTVFDEKGRVVRQQDARGYISIWRYDANGYVSETTAPMTIAGCDPSTSPNRCRVTTDELAILPLSPTSTTTTIRYEHGDSRWPNRPTAIVQSSVLVPAAETRAEYTYHPDTGDVLGANTTGFTGEPAVQEVRGTAVTLYNGQLPAAFSPGGAFNVAWEALPQPLHARMVVVGPRSDVDVTTYVWYPVDPTVPALLRGRLAAVRNGAGHITRYETYDVFGNATRVVDPNGVATESTHDAIGRPLTSTLKAVPACDQTADPLCATDLTTVSSYSPAGGPLAWNRAAGGGYTKYTYDADGHVKYLERGASLTTMTERIEYQFDPDLGLKSAEIIFGLENGTWIQKKRTDFVYDGEGHLLESIHADGTKVVNRWDNGRNLVSVQDENHTVPNTRYAYDPSGRLSTVSQTLGTVASGEITTSYGYDSRGNLTSVDDANGNATIYQYDDFGLMIRQESPVSGATTYTYDAGGNLISTTDANGATTVRTYDGLNRVSSSTSSRAGAPTDTITWTFDSTEANAFGGGRVASMTDPSGTTTYRYERRGLLREEQRTIDGVAFLTKYGYDADGNRKSLTYPSGRLASWTFDFAGRPISLSSKVGNTTTPIVASAQYLPFGPMKSLLYGGQASLTRTMTYDDRYRLATNRLWGGNTTFASYSYGYDAAGNIRAITDLTSAAYDRTFEYDDLGRLIVANGGTSLWGSGGYSYDAMGNMLTASLGTARNATFSYDGTTPKIALATDNGNVVAPQYDGAGNELTGTSDTIGRRETRVYSARNLLARIDAEQSGRSERYTFDGRGVRVLWKEFTGSTQTASRSYVYAPELNLLSQKDATAAALDILWFAGAPIAQQQGTGTLRFTFTDHLGTPVLQTDNAKRPSVLWRAEYEPYGNIFAMRAGTRTDQPLRFPGQEYAWTSASGAEENYNIFRWYRSAWARYSQADPDGVLSDANLFRYVYNRPLMASDPLGLFLVIPGPAEKGISTIICDGMDGIEIQISDTFSDQELNCFEQCLFDHESMHMAHAFASDRGICKGKPRGAWIIHDPSKPEQEELPGEYAGNSAEVNCLRGVIRAGGCCASVARQRDKFVRQEYKRRWESRGARPLPEYGDE